MTPCSEIGAYSPRANSTNCNFSEEAGIGFECEMSHARIIAAPISKANVHRKNRAEIGFPFGFPGPLSEGSPRERIEEPRVQKSDAGKYVKRAERPPVLGRAAAPALRAAARPERSP